MAFFDNLAQQINKIPQIFGNVFKKAVVYTLCFSLIFTQTAWAFNDIVPPKNITDNPIEHIVVDPDRAGNTHLDRAQNGTPVININAASNGGVSANYYRDFNVNDENLILNNYQGEADVSKLGGALHGNPNLNIPGTRAADIILNEVTSSRVSNINGYVEIFGKQAELIIANPNGIMVGGAGFINTSRLSLVTGSSGGLDANGNLNPFLLSDNPNALISIVGRDVVDASGNPVAYNLGIDMSGGNYVDLLSRIVQINGKLLASKEINVITGNDKAARTADGWDVTSTAKSGKPEFAIDSTAMGGIYAGRVNIIATEDGVGVRTRGDVIASVDDIKYDARGVIIIDGENSANRDIKIQTSKTVTNAAEITAGRNIEIAGQSITNTNEIAAQGDMKITADAVSNASGKLIAVGDLDLNLGANDWVSSGTLQSGKTLTLTANNITNANGDITANNLVINAGGNFINGTNSFENILAATNDLNLNVVGDITNHGKITAGRDATITSGGTITNGDAIGGNATIHAGRDMVINAATRILNRGFIQALGKLTMETKATINDDYELNANAQNIPDAEDLTLDPAYQSLYENLATITDTAVLYDLLDNIKTAEQYYAVQKRLRVVRVDALLSEYEDMAADINIATLLAASETELLESLQDLLGEDYDADDWTIDISGDIADINNQIDEQQNRTDVFNGIAQGAAQLQYDTDRADALAEYVDANGDDTGFTYPDFEFTPLTRAEYAAANSETFVDYDALVADAQLVAETTRADKITQVFEEDFAMVQNYKTLDWASMDESEVNDKMSELLGEDYDPYEWMISDFVQAGADLNTAYLNSLRINSIDRAKVEQTGIHNDGRIYSGDNMLLTSNSVLHNNKNSLIYSGGNADFNVRDILLNNANASGQGIFANGIMNIRGMYDPVAQTYGKLNQLINYDGTIESNGDMNIKAAEVINYGSDAIDFSNLDNNIYKAYEYRFYWKSCSVFRCKTKNRIISEEEYNSLVAQGRKSEVSAQYLGYQYVKDTAALKSAYTTEKVHIADRRDNSTVKTDKDVARMTMLSESSMLRSNNGTLSVNADNVTNYNSNIVGYNIDIVAQNLLNSHLTLNVNTNEYYTQRYRKHKKAAGICYDHYQGTKTWTSNVVQTIEGKSPSMILAKNNLSIVANKIGNGTAKIDNFADSEFLPYTPIVQPETTLQEIVRTGNIDPLAGFKLPNGKYGIIRLGDDVNGQYLYESDPTLVDLWHYLGSQYFMNRIGIDPYDVEAKFIGDAFVEHEMIKQSLEQVNAFQNTYMSDAELDEYIDNLYNALTESDVARLGLEFGKELTTSQIAQLDTDIVWYVKQEITLPNGEKVEVLVPQVYLAQDTLDTLYGIALAREDVKTSIRGNNVSIEQLADEANGILTNMGAIVGNRQLVISTDEINNAAAASHQQPVLRGGDLLVLNTGDTGTVNNMSGLIETTNAGSALVINTGELNNITNTQQTTVDRKNYKNVETHIGETATIQSAGDMLIMTDGDLNMAGSKIAADGTALLDVGGDLNSLSIQDYEYEYSKTVSSGTLSKTTTVETSQSVTNIGSGIKTGGDLVVKTGGDATFAGTEINAGGNADLDIGGDTNIVAVLDYDYYNKDVSKSSWGGLVKEKSINETMDQTLQGAKVDVTDGLTINTGNNLNLIASDVEVGGNADVYAGNSINILSAQEVDTEYSFYEKTNYLTDALKAMGTLALAGVTGGASLLVVNDGIDVNCSGGSCGASVEIGSQTKDESYTKTTTSVGSAIKVGGDLKMDAENNINIQGSDIEVGGDGTVTAGNNINIIEAQNSTEHSSSHEDTIITAGVSVGNSYVDAGYAAVALYDAGDAVVKAAEALKHMKDLRDQGRASDEAVRDAELNLAMANLNLLNAELAAVSSVAGAASAASTSFGTGMYGSASMNFETNKNSMDSTTTQSVGSNVFGNNLTFTSGNDMSQVGSNVGANDTVTYNVSNDLNVLASTDTYKTESGSESITAGVSVGNNMVQVNAGYNESKNKTSGTTHNNSTINAENIIVNTGGDATFAGADVHATDSLEMDIGGDLNVESKQDSHYAKGSNWGINAGIGFGSGEDAKGNDQSDRRSGNAGFNVGKSNSDSMWVEDQTSLTGGNVNVNVGGKTTVTGAVIAAGDVDENGNFTDNGQLNLTTNEFEYNDLKDFAHSSDSGFGFSTSVGGSTDKEKESLKPQGSTTISMKSTGSEAEQTTHATVGMGNVTVGGETNPELAGLNRDVDNSQEMTKDMITGSLDASVEIDNRLFTESGRAEIIDQHASIGDNLEQIGKGLTGNIVVASIANAYTDDTKDIFDAVNDYIQQDREMAQLQKDYKDLVGQLNGMTNETPEEAVKVMQQIVDLVTQAGGFNGEVSISNVQGEVYGLAYQSEDGTVKNINLNIANIDISKPGDLMRQIYHETTDFEQHTANEQTATNRGNTGADIFELKNYGNANTNKDGANNQTWLAEHSDNQTITDGSKSFIRDIVSGIVGDGVTNYSTTVKPLEGQPNRYIVTGAAKDRSKAIIAIDADGNEVILGHTTKHDDEFIMYDKDDNSKGAAIGNVIHLDVDITEYMNNKIEQASTEDIFTVKDKFKDYQEYDVKNQIPDDFGTRREGVSDAGHHYDGYVQDGSVVNSRGSGNDGFGRAIHNLPVPNFLSILAADYYQSKGYAKQNIEKFEKDPSSADTIKWIPFVDVPRVWYPESKEAKTRYYEGINTQREKTKNKMLEQLKMSPVNQLY